MMKEMIKEALESGKTALSEHQSKKLLESYGIPVTREKLVTTEEEAVSAAEELGYPVVLKACGPEILHKTEKSLVAVGIKKPDEVKKAYQHIIENLADTEHEGILVYQMVRGERELAIGLIRDPQFGPCVMFGLGGIFTEILRDTSFRVAPITEGDALQMMEEIRAAPILDAFRGQQPADKEKLARALLGISHLGTEQTEVKEVDVNPLIITRKGVPIAVDALVVLDS